MFGFAAWCYFQYAGSDCLAYEGRICCKRQDLPESASCHCATKDKKSRLTKYSLISTKFRFTQHSQDKLNTLVNVSAGYREVKEIYWLNRSNRNDSCRGWVRQAGTDCQVERERERERGERRLRCERDWLKLPVQAKVQRETRMHGCHAELRFGLRTQFIMASRHPNGR